MLFFSYAQNLEDVILWRALKHVDNGFYIDVGAHDPDAFSVTKAFHEHGWHGINIEPVGQWYEKLEAARPNDINLAVAAGSERGEITFYEIPDTGLSTFDSKTAERHWKTLNCEIIERKIQVRTLTDICYEYHAAPIHLLKIDVEGAEQSVLDGLDQEQIRPWIIVIEATLPGSQTEIFYHWEPLVVNASYEFAYFDGVNRYYVAAEEAELKSAFYAPPNIFVAFIRERERDALVRAEEALSRSNQLETELGQISLQRDRLEAALNAAHAQIEQLEADLQNAKKGITKLEDEWDAAKEKIDDLNSHAHHWWTVADKLEQQLMVIYVSKSWRITHPLRVAMNGFKRVKVTIALIPHGMKQAVKAIVKAL